MRYSGTITLRCGRIQFHRKALEGKVSKGNIYEHGRIQGTDRQKQKKIDGQTNGQIDRQTHGQTGRQPNGRTD